MDKQRLQQPLNVVERVTHTGETGKSTDTCIKYTIVITIGIAGTWSFTNEKKAQQF